MAKDQEDVRWLQVPFTREHFNSLSLIAGERGQHITKTVQEACIQFIVCNGKQSKSPRVRVDAASIEEEDRLLQINQLKRLIVLYQDNPDEEKLEQIKQLCDDSNVTIESLIEDLSKVPHITEVLKTDSVSKAQMWLMEKLNPEKPTSVNTLQAMTKNSPFKWHTIQKARDYLNKNTKIQIDTRKDGAAWYWYVIMPAEE